MVQGYVTTQSDMQGSANWAGTTAHFFRIFPHTVVTLVANEVSLALVWCSSSSFVSLSWPNTAKSEEIEGREQSETSI